MRTGSLPHRALLLLEPEPEGLETPHMAAVLLPEVRPVQYAQTKVGQVLRAHERAGRVTRAGHGHAAYNNVRTQRWALTPAGRTWLAVASPEFRAAVAARRERIAAERQALAKIQALIVARGRAQYGPGTPAAVRRLLLPEFLKAGLSGAQIGHIFGVSRQMIRLDRRALEAGTR